MAGTHTHFNLNRDRNDPTSTSISDQPLPTSSFEPGIMPHASDFHIYMMNERARTVPSPKYDHTQSMRIWLTDFEHHARLHGVSNIDYCARYIGNYMPLDIQNWLSRRAPPILARWSLIKESLIGRFGISEEIDNKKRLKELKRCRQEPTESVRLHATKFEYLLSLITETYTEDTEITMFIQSLQKPETRLSLIAIQAALNLVTLDQVINKAIEVEDKARLLEQPQVSQQEDKDSYPTPMDIDAYQRGSKPYQQHRKQLRAYDKDGNPICDLCFKSHRTIDCSQYKQKTNKSRSDNNKRWSHKKKYKGVNHMDGYSSDSSAEASAVSVDIAHLANTKTSKLPRSKLVILQQPCIALWDTGAEISGISQTLAQKIGVPTDTSTIIPYRDVNGNINNTCGTAKLSFGGTRFHVHVINNLAHDLIIGWDTITALQGLVDAKNKTVTIQFNNKTTAIPTIQDEKAISAMESDIQNSEIIKNMIITEYQDVIAENPNKPKVTHLVEFEIDTGDHDPVFARPRTFHPQLEQRINQRLEEMCQDGIMSKISFSRWASNVRPVDKPDGSLRICGNYVPLNTITTPIQYPFVNIHEALQSLGKAKVFTKIDLASGYYQIPIKEQDKEKTALVTKSGFYVFNVMSMGLRNAPMVFQNLMDKVLGVYRFSIAIAYLDDLIIYSSDLDNHIKHIRLVMDRLRYANLSIKLSKCECVLNKIEYLGFLVSDEGIQGSPDKIKPIVEYQAPTNLKEVERFLGMAGVYQRFISQYQLKAEPLRLLKKKDQEFIWADDQQKAFDTLKKDLCLLPTLKQPDFSLTFELHTDAATKAGIAVILCQRYDNTPYPLAFASRSLTPAEKNYSVQELECLAVVFGIKKFRQFLECGTFLVFTDHSSLQWVLKTKEDKQARIWRWCMFLQSYDFKVVYVPGKTNLAADALSRHPLPPSVQVLQNIDWVTEQGKDPDIQNIRRDIHNKPSSFTLQNQLVYKIVKNNRDVTKNHLHIVVPRALQGDILKEFHSSAYAGHFGHNKTKSKILTHKFWWKDMDKDIKTYCSNCKHCQEVKGSKNNNKEIMGNTNGVHPFQRVALNFWGPLPETTMKYKYILVVIDTYTKYVELYPVVSTSAEEVARVFHSNFILRHGIPEEALQDNGPPFTSLFHSQLTELLGTQNLYAPAYHPQSNGIVERFMATLRRMILTYTEQEKIRNEWNKHLRLIQFVYNNTVHSSTTFTPFYLVHDRHPRTPLVTAGEKQVFEHYKSPPLEFALDLQERLNMAFDIVDEHFGKKMINSTTNPFQVGQKVLVFNQANSSSKTKPRKLMFDWIGPFEISKINSRSTVDLKNINSNKIVLNVHISRIKIFNE